MTSFISSFLLAHQLHRQWTPHVRFESLKNQHFCLRETVGTDAYCSCFFHFYRENESGTEKVQTGCKSHRTLCSEKKQLHWSETKLSIVIFYMLKRFTPVSSAMTGCSGCHISRCPFWSSMSQSHLHGCFCAKQRAASETCWPTVVTGFWVNGAHLSENFSSEKSKGLKFGECRHISVPRWGVITDQMMPEWAARQVLLLLLIWTHTASCLQKCRMNHQDFVFMSCIKVPVYTISKLDHSRRETLSSDACLLEDNPPSARLLGWERSQSRSGPLLLSCLLAYLYSEISLKG